jgi:hypothetical protein
MRPSGSWTTDKRRARWIGGALPIVGIGGALIVAAIWGTPGGVGVSVTLGRLGIVVLGGAILLVVLGLMLPLAIAAASRATPTPDYLGALKLSSAADLMTATPSSPIRDSPRARGVAGFVCSDWSHWGPVARVTCADDNFHIEPSKWPVLGRRLVPNLTVPWDHVDTLETVGGARDADILVLKISDPRLAFGLWLGPMGAGRLAAEFRRKHSEVKRPAH